jgi:hypothetical protein
MSEPVKKITVIQKKAQEKEARTRPTPIMASRETWPQHVKDHPLQERAGILDRYGVPVRGKKGSYKHQASIEDIYDDEGNPLPIHPLFADRMKVGKIAEDLHGFGGPGFPSHPDWYGIHGWANLFARGNGGVANGLTKLLHESYPKHGFLGLVTLGDHKISSGNRAFIDHLKSHVLPQLDTSEKEGAFMDMIRTHKWGIPNFDISSVKDPADFFKKIGDPSVSTTARAIRMESLVGKVKVPRVLADLDMPSTYQSFNDYAKVPTGHGTTLVRFLPQAKDFDGTLYKNKPREAGRSLDTILSRGGTAQDHANEHPGSPVYSAHIGGTYLGELQHSLPLHNIVSHKITGGRSFVLDGSHYMMGQERPLPKSKGGGIKPAGRMEVSGMAMGSPQSLLLDHDAVASKVLKAIPIIIIKSTEPFDNLTKSGYNGNEGGDNSMEYVKSNHVLRTEHLMNQMPKDPHEFAAKFATLSPDDHFRVMLEMEHRNPASPDMEGSTMEAIEATKSPEAQARLRQALMGSVKR